MTAYSINAVARRVVFSGSAGTGPYAFTFEIIVNTDVAVFLDTTLLTLTTDYAVTINSNGTGSVALNTGTTNVPNAPTSSNTITILGARSIERTTDFVTAGDLKASSLNEQLDALTIFDQQISERVDRALIGNFSDPTTLDMTIPSVANRKGKVLGFHSSTGAPEAVAQLTGAAVNVSTVTVGGSASASVSVSGGVSTFALGIPTGATGATGAIGPRGSDAGLALTFNTSTSDADPGAGKLALNNGTVSSASIAYIDDVDDNSVNISSFVQSWDDVSNATARGILLITKEGTPSTYAMFKISGAVTNASGYSKVPLTHVVSNGTFSNADGITVQFSYSGNDGSGSLTNVVGDTSPELGGNLDVLTRDIVSSSNRDIDLAPHGTGHVTVLGNTNPGSIQFNCESNSHGQLVKSQPHSATVTNVLTLPAGGDGEIVSNVATQTLTNKTLSSGGSITSSFGNIDNGSSLITTTGTISGGDVVVGDDISVGGRATSHVTTDNDGSFDLSVGNDFKCTTAGGLTLTFTNPVAGQSGNIMFINGSNHTIAAHASVAINADVLTAISATGTYHLAYYCSAASGNNTILVSGSAILT